MVLSMVAITAINIQWQKPNSSVIAKMTQKQLAEQMGMSVDTLQNYETLINMIPEIESSY